MPAMCISFRWAGRCQSHCQSWPTGGWPRTSRPPRCRASSWTPQRARSWCSALRPYWSRWSGGRLQGLWQPGTLLQMWPNWVFKALTIQSDIVGLNGLLIMLFKQIYLTFLLKCTILSLRGCVNHELLFPISAILDFTQHVREIFAPQDSSDKIHSTDKRQQQQSHNQFRTLSQTESVFRLIGWIYNFLLLMIYWYTKSMLA